LEIHLPMKPIDVVLLSRSDIVGLELTPAQVVAAVELALAEHAAGTFEMHPKIGVHPTGTDPANFIHAMPAWLKTLGACGLKWVAGYAKNHLRDLPNVTGLQVFNDTETGIPLAIMDCSYLTGLRTAAVSAIAARCCSLPDSKVLALAGCGFEGSKHLRFLIDQIPSLEEVRLRDIRPEAMERLKAEASEYFSGKVVLCSDNATCFDSADVIATCTNGDEQLIRQEWFKPGAFGVGIEGGCAYTAEALQSADKFIVDDIPLAEYFDRIGQNRKTEDGQPDPEFPGGMPPVYATIGQVLTGQKAPRTSATERIVAIPIGMAICDVALSHLTYHTAIKRNVGQQFRLA
jgi:ornithine cyclodeaminase/alanine dehydrogenase-like protein (mu-crystallin family)